MGLPGLEFSGYTTTSKDMPIEEILGPLQAALKKCLPSGAPAHGLGVNFLVTGPQFVPDGPLADCTGTALRESVDGTVGPFIARVRLKANP